MKREIDDLDHESFRASARSVLDHEVRPTWASTSRPRSSPGRCGWPSAGRSCPPHRSRAVRRFAAGDFCYNALLREQPRKVSMSLSSCRGIHADIVTRRPGRVTDAAAPRWTSRSMNER
jgi:hypothetical protein